jgi:hypothetical protein
MTRYCRDVVQFGGGRVDIRCNWQGSMNCACKYFLLSVLIQSDTIK